MKRINNCENNDVFAYRIGNDKRYNGRYLILIRYISDYYNDLYESGHPNHRKEDLYLYRCKITLDDKLPRNHEELENLPYIKIEMIDFYKRYMPLSGTMTYEELVESRSYAKFYPDEYNYLYSYLFCVLEYEEFKSKKNGLDDYIYLGNFDLSQPKEEYFPFSISKMGSSFFEALPQKLIQSYEDYNLKKNKCYDPEENQRLLESSKRFMNVFLERRRFNKTENKSKDD